MFYIHKGFDNKKVNNLSEDELKSYFEAGWKVGKCPAHWITNGVKNKLLPEGKDLPEGFYFGQSDDLKHKNSVGNKIRWANTPEERREEIRRNISIGTKNWWDLQTEEDIKSREYNKQQSRNKWTAEEKEKYHKKMSESAKRNRENTTKEEYHRRSVLATKTKKINGTFSYSSYEENCYKLLCESYGEENIIREYLDDVRYPFKCDFYIKSLDLFIELNIHPSHNNHKFDIENINDVEVAQQLRCNNNSWSNMILDVWCNRDIEKFNIAELNNLNYLVIYPKEYEKFLINIREKTL